MTIYLIQRVWSEATGYGRSEYKSELQPGRGYFMSTQEAQPTLDILNADYCAQHNKQETRRIAQAASTGVEIDRIPFEESNHLPRFVLAEIPPAPGMEA